jgi:hypothetical protein
MALDQETALNLHIFPHLVNILNMFEGLMILYPYLRTIRIDLDSVEVSIADLPCQIGATQFSLCQDSMKLIIGKLIQFGVWFVMMLIDM